VHEIHDVLQHVGIGLRQHAPPEVEHVPGAAGVGVEDGVHARLDDVERARTTATVPFTAVTSWATEPAYIAFLAGAVREKLAAMPDDTTVLFTAHSLPKRIVELGDPYPDEIRATADLVAADVGLDRWAGYATGWQSAGRTPEPWLGPDILEVIADAAGPLLVCPCGFVSDHLEVLFDLDVDAAAAAARKGIPFARTRVLNDDRDVLAALAARVKEAS
jgi:ferrochelatase